MEILQMDCGTICCYCNLQNLLHLGVYTWHQPYGGDIWPFYITCVKGTLNDF
jgi:hypothetical protein